MSTAAPAPARRGAMQRLLDGVERVGNRMPHPAILFLALCAAIIVLSQILYWTGWDASYEVIKPAPVPAQETYYGGSVVPVDIGPTQPEPAEAYHVEHETASVQGLLTGEGVRYLFTSFVDNFRNFAAVAIILVVMIGVGVAELSGLIAALIRKLVDVSSNATLTLIIVLLGMLSTSPPTPATWC
jgi:aminobenzoyl-glutamate transport protein